MYVTGLAQKQSRFCRQRKEQSLNCIMTPLTVPQLTLMQIGFFSLWPKNNVTQTAPFFDYADFNNVSFCVSPRYTHWPGNRRKPKWTLQAGFVQRWASPHPMWTRCPCKHPSRGWGENKWLPHPSETCIHVPIVPAEGVMSQVCGWIQIYKLQPNNLFEMYTDIAALWWFMWYVERNVYG